MRILSPLPLPIGLWGRKQLRLRTRPRLTNLNFLTAAALSHLCTALTIVPALIGHDAVVYLKTTGNQFVNVTLTTSIIEGLAILAEQYGTATAAGQHRARLGTGGRLSTADAASAVDGRHRGCETRRLATIAKQPV